MSGDENNLNKPSLRDSQTFSHNISTSESSSKNNNEDSSKNSEKDNADISPEEVGRILNEAAQELEEDARKAMRGLEEDKEIMKRLQEIKQRRKESSSDVNRGIVISSKCDKNPVI